MKKYSFLLLLILLFSSGCNRPSRNEVVLIRINRYEITADEFGREFKDSVFCKEKGPDSKKEFLDNLITRQLILQDAQKNNLDKGRGFLEMIQRFWEDTLLKLALDKKVKSVAALVEISDKEVEEAYGALPESERAGKTYEQLYHKIRWDISRQKESLLMDAWVASLRKDSRIVINSSLLDKDR